MPTTGYRIAGRLSDKNQTLIEIESQFAKRVRELFARIRPRRIIETGTYWGTGTTTIIATALADAGIDDAQFVSIEINPKNFQRAQANLAKLGLNVELIHGLSVPRNLLPTMQQIEEQFVRNVESDGLIVDHEEIDRVQRYYQETDFRDLPDDLLGKTLRRFDDQPDFVLLDSGGHMGYVEFCYLLQELRGPCHLALDDIYHVKHHRSFQQIKNDPRFSLVAVSEEKFGFCIARFEPTNVIDKDVP
jgi:hypothetical protein